MLRVPRTSTYDDPGEPESLFLQREFFAKRAEEALEPRAAAMIVESPFVSALDDRRSRFDDDQLQDEEAPDKLEGEDELAAEAVWEELEEKQRTSQADQEDSESLDNEGAPLREDATELESPEDLEEFYGHVHEHEPDQGEALAELPETENLESDEEADWLTEDSGAELETPDKIIKLRGKAAEAKLGGILYEHEPDQGEALAELPETENLESDEEADWLTEDSGAELETPDKIIKLRGKAAEDKLAELGGILVTDPDYSDGRKAVVGSHIQYTVLGARTRTSTIGVHQWTHDGPDGFHMQSITGVSRRDPIPSAAPGPHGMFVNAHNVGSTTIPLSKVGKYTTKAWVRAGVDNNGVFEGYELYIDHSVDVTHLFRATHEAYGKLGKDTDSFQKFHDTMDIQTTLLRPGGPDQQNQWHQFKIATSTPNPAAVSTSTLPFSAQDARTDKSKPPTYHWYVSPQTKDKPPEKLGGKSMVSVGGRTGYDFGTGPSIALPGEYAGFWVVWYQAKDNKGANVGEASYFQTILSGSDMKSLEKHDKYMQTLDELGGKIEGEKVPVKGVHVSSTSGGVTQLRLFIGRKTGEPSTFVLIDVTPGLDPKSNRFEYTSSTGDGAIREFLSNNKYPKGMFRFHATSNKLGVDVHEHQKETSGQGTFDRLSSNLSIGGMVALGVGILAAPFTRGQSLQVAIVVSGGLTAAGAAVSLYDRLQNAEVSGTGVALDIVTIASSLINAGSAVHALKSGPRVLLANRATKFLLWSNFVAEGVSALLIAAEGVQQIAAIIENDSMRPEQKRAAVLRIITNLIMTGALLAVSAGQMREFRAKNVVIDYTKPLSSSGYKSTLQGERVGVFEGWIPEVKGPVAIKVYRERHPVFEHDLAGAQAASRTGYAAKFYREVPAGPGKRAFAMEKIPGGFPEAKPGASAPARKEAAKAAANVTQQTVTDIKTYGQKLLDEGFYYKGEVQGLVDKSGRWRAIDFQAIRKLPPKANAAEYDEAIKQHWHNVNWEAKGLNKHANANARKRKPKP